MDILKTASFKSAVQNSPAEILTQEAFAAALARGLDRVWRRPSGVLQQGMQFVREGSMTRLTETYQTFRGIGGLVMQNDDEDEIPFASAGDGFSYTVTAYNFRRGVRHARTLEEVDDVGVIRKKQSDLSDAGKRTIEWAIADIWNRSVDDSDGGYPLTNAPILCDDGGYLVDSGRPNANAAAGTWGNVEAAGALTPSAVFQAQLNARATVDDNGDKMPLRVRALMITPQDAKTAWEIRNSTYRPTDALNVNNYFKEAKDATFDIVPYDYMTTRQVIYWLGDPKSEDNELELKWRVRPSFMTWVGDNVDVLQQRIRFSFGIGCGSPRKMIRGGRING